MTRESNYIADAVIWPKFGNSSISMRNASFNFIMLSPEKSIFLMGGLSSIIWD